jgi:hypothetical protein
VTEAGLNRLQGKVAISTGCDGGHLAHQPQYAEMMDLMAG